MLIKQLLLQHAEQNASEMSDGEILQTSFLQIVSDLSSYLRPICDAVNNLLRSPSSSANPYKEAPSVQETVVILADKHLLQLPLEALECFRADSINAISRDLSLQMLYHKIHVEQPPGEKIC